MWRGRLNAHYLRILIDGLLKDRVNFLRVFVIALFLYLAERGITATFREWDWVTVNSVGGQYWATLLKSIGPELGGIVIGIVVIDWLNERRQEQQLKAQLIRQMGSYYADVAVTAANELRHLGWGFSNDRSLVRALLERANLEKANLAEINLEMAFLQGVNLENAFMANANLETARLKNSNLKGANLMNANLKYAHLTNANLEGTVLTEAELNGAYMALTNLKGAFLYKASLEGTKLYAANLRGAYLYMAKFVTPELLAGVKSFAGATMPDGSKPEEWVFKLFREGEIDDTTLTKLSKLSMNDLDEEE